MRTKLIFTLALVLILVTTTKFVTYVEAIEHKCSANVIIAEKLWSKLEVENKGLKELDLTHRLDSKGERLGGKIDYRDSEIRYLELMEDICETLPIATPVPIDGTVRWTDLSKNKNAAVFSSKLYSNKEKKLELKTVLINHCTFVLDEYEENLVQFLRKGDWEDKAGKSSSLHF